MLLGYTKPKELMKQYSKLNYKSCAISDYNSLSGSVNFFKACKDSGINPIIGTRVKIINPENQSFGYISLYAKNKLGWFELVKLTSNLYLTDELSCDIQSLRLYSNLACIISGNDFIDNNDSIKILKDIFKEDIFIGTDRRNNKNKLSILEGISENLNIKMLASPLVAYSKRQDKNNHLTMYSSHLGITQREWVSCGDSNFSQFYHGDYSLPEKLEGYNIDEVKNLELFESLFEQYSILERPTLPDFDCPNGLSQSEYLRQLCREGYKKKLTNLTQEQKIIYGDRVNRELEVINKANLEGYFLIVQDYINWAKNQGWLVGVGRGSSAGSLIAYLTNITGVDPIKYSLLFERFYNDGRNTADKVSYPDIDTDFPVDKREEVIEYIRNKYGRDKVTQVVTFSSLQGRGALKEVLRVNQACPPKMMDEISKNLPMKDKISDLLEESKESSIINWTLKYEPKRVSDYCELKEDGTFTGPYAAHFEQAIEIESTFKNFGKHASALVISRGSMIESCPMIKEKNGSELIAGIEYTEMEEMGKVKMDLLGLKILDKLSLARDILKGK